MQLERNISTWTKIVSEQMNLPENMDMKETCLSVLGIDMTIPMMVTMTEKMTVQSEWSDRVLRTLAPVRMWKPTRRMLLAKSIKAVKW